MSFMVSIFFDNVLDHEEHEKPEEKITHYPSAVARMERSGIREIVWVITPDFTPFHPGYGSAVSP
jgi:hypothetical protein